MVRTFRADVAVAATMRTVQMSLLFDDIEVIESAGDPTTVEIRGIAHDSRRVVPGDLFCCVPGLISDGHDHASEAVDRGAVGLLCEHFIPELLDRPVVQSRIAPGTARPVMAQLAAAFYGHPARDLLMVGVTGTNGKTTVTQLLGDVLEASGRPTNVMGTLSARAPRRKRPKSNACWPEYVTGNGPTDVVMPWPWRCPAMRWCRRG